MKVTKQVEIPAQTQTQLDYVKCELCDATTNRYDNWSGRSYEVSEVTVSFKSGQSFPEGGSTETTVLDICPKCFDEKLMPWFVAQGGTSRKEEIIW